MEIHQITESFFNSGEEFEVIFEDASGQGYRLIGREGYPDPVLTGFERYVEGSENHDWTPLEVSEAPTDWASHVTDERDAQAEAAYESALESFYGGSGGGTQAEQCAAAWNHPANGRR